MYIFVFIIITILVQYITNKLLGLNSQSTLSYEASKRDTYIMLGFLVVSIILQKVIPKGKIFWIGLGVFSGALLITLTILGAIKRIKVKERQEEIKSVFEVLEPVIPNDSKVKNKETQEFEIKDINNPPFKLGYEGNRINRITIKINPNTFKEPVAVNLCLSLNKYLPNYEWVNEFDFAARECAFVGTPLPPGVAKYKGSWLRPTEFIPIGLSGLGEVSWTINSIKNTGKSNYIYEDGKVANTVDTPSAPQALCIGSPLSIDTIIPTTNGYKTMETIKVGDYVFDKDNKPVKVLEVHKIHTEDVYKLTFTDTVDTVSIIADNIHKFPKVLNNSYIEVMSKDLQINDIILGTKQNYTLVEKIRINKCKVRCITVNSDLHLFAINDKKHTDWTGGLVYPYNSVLTRNTGGGKSIYVNQIVETQSIETSQINGDDTV